MTGDSAPTPGWERLPGDLPTMELVDALRNAARGWLPAEAGVELLHAHGSWLKRKALRQRIDYSADDGGFARIRWAEVAAELEQHFVPASGSEYQVLQVACGLTTDKARWSLWDTISSLDATNLHLVMQAMAHARGWHEYREHPDNAPGIARVVTGQFDDKEL